MFPLTVVGRNKYFPKATVAIIAVNILVFLWELSVDAPRGMDSCRPPCRITDWKCVKIGEQTLGTTTLDTFRSLFLHGSFAHVLGNMWFLFLFGGLVEKYLGTVKFVGAYLAFGALATLAHVVFGHTICTVTDSGIVIGASGAVAGVMGGFLFLRPNARVRTMLGFFRPFVWSVNIPAFLFLVIGC